MGSGTSSATCWKRYEKKELIGSSTNSYVYLSCRKGTSDCKYAVKVTKNNLVVAETDAKMIQSLQNEKWIDVLGQEQNLVPRFYEARICPNDEFHLVTEAYDWDLRRLGKHQRNLLSISPKTEEVLVYTRAQLFNMFRIAKRLDEIGIIHGDLSPSKFYIRDNSIMFVGDFGTTFRHGWTQRLGCTEEKVMPDGWFNRWQLETSLQFGVVTIVIDATKECYFHNIGIPDEYRETISEKCTEYEGAINDINQWFIDRPGICILHDN
jgi:hypothetical protein